MQFLKYFILAIALLSAVISSQAQKQKDINNDIVHLKDGEKLEGTIIEVYHDHYVDIIDTKRQKIRIMYRDVQSIQYGDEFKGKVKYNNKLRSQANYHIPGKKTYCLISLDGNMGRGQRSWVDPGRGLSLSTGYRFSKNAVVGIGAGIDSYDFFFRNLIAPIFAEYRYEFWDRSFTPFATMRAGYGFSISGNTGNRNGFSTEKVGGLYLNPLFGVRLRTQKKGHFQFALGWKIQNYTERGVQFSNGPNGEWIENLYKDTVLFSRMTINVSVMF